MLQQISIFIYKFLFVLSIVYIIRFVIETALKILSEDTTPLNTNKLEIIFLYFAISYFITYLIF